MDLYEVYDSLGFVGPSPKIAAFQNFNLQPF